MISRRSSIKSILATVSAIYCATPVYAKDPITIVFPFSPGASGDINIRLITKTITDKTGINFVIENKPGANGIIASELVKRAKKNGKTLLVANSGSHAINEIIFKGKLPYDSVNDFEPITLLWEFPCVLAVPTNGNISNINDLIRLSKNKSGISFGSAGPGSGGHILGELLAKSINGNLVHVPYKGASPAVNDLVAGLIDIFFVSYSSIKSQVESGNLKIIGVASDQRLKAIPDVPTLEELSIKDVKMSNWFGLVAPSNTDKKTVNEINSIFLHAIQDKDIEKRLNSEGVNLLSSTPEYFSKKIKEDIESYKKSLAELGIKE